MSRSIEQWAYGAILDYWDRWNAARLAIYRKRPRRRSGAALALALTAATTLPPNLRRRHAP